MNSEQMTGERRCWPCTIANSAAGFVVGWLPVAAAFAEGSAVLIGLSLVWALAVTGYTVYRLAALGYLPLAESVAKATGLHDRIGPDAGGETGADSATPDE